MGPTHIVEEIPELIVQPELAIATEAALVMRDCRG
jgi:hypothetical protein